MADLTPKLKQQLEVAVAETYGLGGQAETLKDCANPQATKELKGSHQNNSDIYEAQIFCPALIAGAADQAAGFQGLISFFNTPKRGDHFANKDISITPENIANLEDTLAMAVLTHNEYNIAPNPNRNLLLAVFDKTAAIAGAAWKGLNPNKNLADELPAILARQQERNLATKGTVLRDNVKPQLLEITTKKVNEALAKVRQGGDVGISACFADTKLVNGKPAMEDKLACALAGEKFVKPLIKRQRQGALPADSNPTPGLPSLALLRVNSGDLDMVG